MFQIGVPSTVENAQLYWLKYTETGNWADVSRMQGSRRDDFVSVPGPVSIGDGIIGSKMSEMVAWLVIKFEKYRNFVTQNMSSDTCRVFVSSPEASNRSFENKAFEYQRSMKRKLQGSELASVPASERRQETSLYWTDPATLVDVNKKDVEFGEGPGSGIKLSFSFKELYRLLKQAKTFVCRAYDVPVQALLGAMEHSGEDDFE